VATRKGYPLSGGTRGLFFDLTAAAAAVCAALNCLVAPGMLKAWSLAMLAYPALYLAANYYFLAAELHIYQRGVVRRGRLRAAGLRDEDVAGLRFAVRQEHTSYVTRDTVCYLLLQPRAGPERLRPIRFRAKLPPGDDAMAALRHRLAVAGGGRILAGLAEGRQSSWCQGLVLRPEGLAVPRRGLFTDLPLLSLGSGEVIPYLDRRILLALQRADPSRYNYWPGAYALAALWRSPRNSLRRLRREQTPDLQDALSYLAAVHPLHLSEEPTALKG
jgi:hypothetical protein